MQVKRDTKADEAPWNMQIRYAFQALFCRPGPCSHALSVDFDRTMFSSWRTIVDCAAC